MSPRYSMVIRWSDEDQPFIASLPEFGPYCNTHGETYVEAAKRGQEAMESLIEAFQEWGKPIPERAKFDQFDSPEESATAAIDDGHVMKRA